MLKIRFADGSAYEVISPLVKFSNEIPIKITSSNEISLILDKMTDNNLSKIEFLSDDDSVTEIYTNKCFDHAEIHGQKFSIFFTDIDETTQHLNELDQAIVELASLIAGEE